MGQADKKRSAGAVPGRRPERRRGGARLKVILKIRPRHLFKAIRLPLLTAVVFAVVADIWCETIGVPQIFAHYLSNALGKQGMSCRFDTVKAGFFRGVQVHGAILWDGEGSGRELFTAERVRLRFRKAPLLAGRLVPDRVDVAGGTVFFPTPPGEDRIRRLPFALGALNVKAEIGSDTVRLSRCRGTLNGLVLDISGDISGLEKIRERIARSPEKTALAAGDQPFRLSWEGITARIPAQIREQLPQLRDFLGKQLFVTDDAVVSGTFHLDPENFAACRLEAMFQFADVSLRDLAIRKIKGHIALKEGGLTLRNATLDVGSGAFVSGTATYDFATRLVAGQLRGELAPAELYRFIRRPMPQPLAELSFPVPPSLSLTLFPSPAHEVAKWELAGEVSARNIFWGDMQFHTATCRLSRKAGIISIEKLEIEADRDGRETAVIRCDLNESDWSLSGTGTISADPCRFLRFLPGKAGSVGRFLKMLRIGHETPTLSATLERGCLKPFELRGRAELKARRLAFRDLEVASLEVPLRFDGEILEIAPDGIRLLIDDCQQIILHGKADIGKRSLSLIADSALFPGDIYRRLQLPKSYLIDELQLAASPVHATWQATDMPFDFADWRVTGTIEVRDLLYGACTIDTGSARFELTPAAINLIDATAASFQVKDLIIPELTYNWREYLLTIRGTGQVDPRLFAAFIPPSGRPVYENSWRRFDWGVDDPRLEIRDFRFQLYSSNRWSVRLLGSIADENLRFSNLALDRAAAEVTLDLPRSIRIADITAASGGQWVNGEVALEFDREPVLTFDGKGVFDPVEVSGVAVPALSAALVGIETGADTQLDMDGQVYLTGRLRPQVSCRMQGSSLKAKGLKLGSYTSEWQLADHELKWRISHAKVCGGDLVAGGYGNGFTKSGKVEAKFRNLGLSELVTDYSGKPATPNLGLLSGSFSLDSARPGGTAEVLLVGGGKVKVRDGEFYRTPLIQSLVGLVGLSGVGQITACDAEFEFSGDHLEVPRFATNGTILALAGEGKYYWREPNKGMNFTVRGQMLKATGLIPLLTRPFSWFFEAELTGTLDAPDWRMKGPLRRILPGKQKKAEEEDDFDLLPNR